MGVFLETVEYIKQVFNKCLLKYQRM